MNVFRVAQSGAEYADSCVVGGIYRLLLLDVCGVCAHRSIGRQRASPCCWYGCFLASSLIALERA